MPAELPLADGHILLGSPTTNVGTADECRLQQTTVGATIRSAWRFAMPPANAINVRRSAYVTARSGSPGNAHLRLIANHAPAIAFNESQHCWNLPQTGENWGSTPTGGGALGTPVTTYSATARNADVRYEDALQEHFEAALARGDAFFTLIEHLDVEDNSANVALRYGTKEAVSTPTDKRPWLLYDLSDATDPTVTVTSHTDGQKVATSGITLAGTAADVPGEDEPISGVEKVEVNVNGAGYVDVDSLTGPQGEGVDIGNGRRFKVPDSTWSEETTVTTIWDDGGREPSGIAYHAPTNKLFVADDGSRLYVMNLNGTERKFVRIQDTEARDLEGIAVADQTSDWIYVLDETLQLIYEVSASAVVAADGGTTVTPRRIFDFSALNLLDGGNGPEGLAFVPIEGHPEGGVFWIGTQKDGRAYVVELKIATSTTDVTVTHLTGEPYNSPLASPVPGSTDLADLHCDPVHEIVYWLHDDVHLVGVTRLDGTAVAVFGQPEADGEKNYEGFTLGPDGEIYLADDGGDVDRVEYGSLGLGPVTNTVDWEHEIGPLVAGDNLIEVRATDAEGNVSNVTELTIRLSTVEVVIASSHLGYVTSDSGFARTVIGDVLVGRAGTAAHRGFAQFAADDLAELPEALLAVGLRFNLTEKNGVIVDSDELEIVIPLVDDYDVEAASDEDLYGQIGSSSVKMAAVAYNIATGSHTIDLGSVGIESLLTLIGESANFPIGLRFKNNGAGVNWEFARASDMQLVVTVPGFASGGAGRRALLGVGR